MPLSDWKPLEEALAGRYTIERQLGQGGFASVYLARDLRHDRYVALKVLHSEIAEAVGPERFDREVKLAARLQHPHILGVFDSGIAAGRMWFTMPYIEGETLRDKLKREHQLNVEEAVTIAREVADALDYAHKHGVIHRDIKPENILLTGRHAMVADFGIARAISTSEEAITRTGLVVGTPGYMSPEQASGERELDARSDIYALASVLYEMLGGQPPFASATTQTTIARMMTQDAQPLHNVRSGVTEELDQALLKALSRVPADRPSSASEFADSLAAAVQPSRSHETRRSELVAKRDRSRRIAAAIAASAVVALLAVTAILLNRRQTPDARSLAVLPFDNIGRAEDAYFADGITEEVRGKLASIPGLRVTARSSSAQYKKSSKTPKEIGGELGVQYLLTGTVRWDKREDGQRTVRVTPELVLASDGSTKWQEPFDVVMSDIFDAQTTIASQVAQKLDLELSSSVRDRISKAPTENLAAYDEFLRGEQGTDAMANPDPVRLDSGFVHYAKAAQLDPAFLQSLGRVAQIDISRFTLRPSAETSKTALDAVTAAERVDPRSTIAHRVRALYMRDVEKNSRSAHDELLAALRTDPNDAQLLATTSSTENSLGLFDSALVHVQRAAQIDPKSGTVVRQLATTLGYARRFPEAIVEYNKLIATNPANLDAVQAKIRVQILLGDMPGAKQTITDVLAHVDSLTLGIRLAYYQEMMWILDKSILKKVAAAKPMDFYKDPAMGSLKIGRTLLLLGDSAGGRVWGDTALHYIGPQIKENPDDAQLAEVRGRVNALAGNRAEAIADAERSLALRETKTDAAFGPYYKFQVARIMIQAGEYDRAIDLLEPLLTAPAGMLTPAWLRLDPNFAPLRSNPRFRKMAGLA